MVIKKMETQQDLSRTELSKFKTRRSNSSSSKSSSEKKFLLKNAFKNMMFQDQK